MKRCDTLAFVAVLVLLSAEACAEEPPTPGSADLPVTNKRLTGARLEYHRADPKLVWSFSKERFILAISGRTVPRELIEVVTGKRDTVARIEGMWMLDERQGVLTLSTDRADGKVVRHRARLAISPAGLVRIDLGDYQYNVFPGEAELGVRQPKLAFKQVGSVLVVTMTMEIPDAPHVIWTRGKLLMDHDPYLRGPRRPPKLDSVQLAYHVIQCRDDPVLLHMRHRKKKVEVSWRLTDHEKADVPYRVVDHFNPSAAELIELAPKLSKIAENTRQRASLAIP